jgi:hypothetical protein
MACYDAVAPEVFVCGTTPTGDHVTAGRRQRTLTMNILKFALLGSLRIAFFGFLKVAICAYTLTRPLLEPRARVMARLATLFPTGRPKVTAMPMWLSGTQHFQRPAPHHNRFKVNRSWSLSVCLLALVHGKARFKDLRASAARGAVAATRSNAWIFRCSPSNMQDGDAIAIGALEDDAHGKPSGLTRRW